ncbi:zinc transport system periplasmic zinc-binding protein TroA [Gottschalkia acidurici 9a]|uniref:Zinc transport system periplasmic zinc-binding protein TroA n=1 Tax=Gottschalkia acidurici (strain ATCC 7906 / DSM 604 / BCRC 14475 / CIP 104303 / KCTC 5404 / NCIMB 10678 / 9a) TaxID=1128398 RepID=K0AYH2_GOTA9|nr:zinc ABC transporter substrate-binding protein [Gottschalkia acidurici]AFS77426.1 zinc transport system periplasmic zinc-binding protein TroA [Gottschalkia acidurici 9a]
MKRFISIIMILSLLVLTLIGCNNKPQDEITDSKENEKIKVVATTTMITDLVKAIGGENIEVQGLVGPGIDPHLYKASAGDVNKMQNADAIFYNGLYLEGKMGEIFENLEKINIKTVAISKDIDKSELLQSEEFEGNFDPHIWFDVSLWIKATETVKNSLIELDAANKQEYEKNAEEYMEQLRKLNQYVIDKVEKVPQEKRILITAHDAFNYFGRAYKFEVKGLQGISTASEAGTSDVKNLAEFIVEEKIPAIFIESSLPRRNVEALQEAVKARGFDVEIGGELFSDSLGEVGTEGGDYAGMVKHNIDTITKNFEK